ncbi:hypothetical protein D1224_02760 [Henriciella barbarensis]|uniref:L,D-TPase catalytic domain-containing protein n=1 Tax=Henriciella barbarensis TaxID=86342 RepID=A0A399R569_9PROT|nr:L,D-transpeptidase family protein [Henriciella barbarensis]RIJ26053.1 hypothetical protein D1224_02760 [Henriciella barbarensis]
MKPLFLSVILASASPVALAQVGGDGAAIRAASATEQAAMPGAAVSAPLPNAIETAVMNDWLEAELDQDLHKSVSEVARRAYIQRMFQPVWTEQGAQGLQDVAGDLFKHGLASDDVLASDLQQLIDQRFSTSNASEQAKADLALTAAWLRIASAISGGLGDEGEAVESGSNSARMALVSKKLLEAGQGHTLSFQDFESGYPQYAALKGALAQYREIRDSGGWLAISEGESLEAGDSDPRVPAIRERLSVEGYTDRPKDHTESMLFADADRSESVFLQGRNSTASGNRRANLFRNAAVTKTETNSKLYSDDLVEAVKTFQQRHGIEVDGVIGPKTLAAMNESVESKMARIAGSMERWRAQGAEDQRYIWANIPSYTVEGWNGDTREISMKSVVGMASRATPTFNDEIEYTVANPRWYAPVSIVAKDKLPKLRRDPSYAQRANFKIYDRSSGAEVSAYSVDWNDPSSARKYRLVQQPGSGNALGELKIIFPNQYSIYLHGTPSTHLFDRAERAFSSGCIRLEQPERMAEWVASYDSNESLDDVRDALSTTRNTRIDFQSRMPIHITYMTVTVNDDGTVNFWRDIYDRTEGIRQVERMSSIGQTANAQTSEATERG